MQAELSALEENRIWELTALPKGKKAIDSKWGHKIKYNVNGSVDKYKPRLVAKGYNQEFGIDSHISFSPVAKMVMVRLLLAVAAASDWPVYQLDINNTYLHGVCGRGAILKTSRGLLQG